MANARKPPHHHNSAFCTKNIKKNHQLVERLRRISFEISCIYQKQSLDDMLVYAKDFDFLADYQFLNSSETHLQITNK